MNINSLHARAAAGDREAEKRLFDWLSVRFRAIAFFNLWNEQDAEEAAQESLMTVAEKYVEVRDHENFIAWAYKVLRYRILVIRRKRRLVKSIEIQVESESSVEQELISHDPMFKRRLLDCLNKINGINTRHARILNLHHAGYSTAEICERLELSRNNFYIVLHRARIMLQKCLQTGEIK